MEELNAASAAVAAAGGAFQLVLVSSDRNVDGFAKLLGARRTRVALSRRCCRVTYGGVACADATATAPAASLPGALALPYTDSLKAKEEALCKQFQVRCQAAPAPPTRGGRLRSVARPTRHLTRPRARHAGQGRACAGDAGAGRPGGQQMCAPRAQQPRKAHPPHRNRNRRTTPATPHATPPAGARARVVDPAAFPWPPPSLAEALGPSFENEHGDRVALSALLGPRKYLALYFGAASCGRCRSFTRRLAEAYAAVLREGGGCLEVIYVSGDRSAEEAAAARRGAPWLSLPYAERWRADALRDILEVGSTPALVLLDSALRVANGDARAAADRMAPFPWLPRLVWDADARADWERSPAEAPVLIVLAERAGSSWDALEAAMAAVANEAAQQPPLLAPAGGRAAARPVFMLARERQGLGMAVRRLARLGEAGPRPQALLLDMSAGGTFYVLDAAKELNAANLRAFLAAYAAGSLLPQAAGPVQTITVTVALTHVPAGGADDVDVNPWEVRRSLPNLAARL